MLFSSSTFIYAFLPCFVLLYGVAETLAKKESGLFRRLRVPDILTLAFSLCFYAWACFDNVIFLVVMIAAVYLAGLLIRRMRKGPSGNRSARLVSGFCVIILVLILYFYKYSGLTPAFGALWGIHFIPVVTPLGLSFLVFTMISYLVDVFRGADNGSFLDAALFISFFPKVISGPIVKWNDWIGFTFERRIREPYHERLYFFIERFVIGLCKKVLIADSFGAIIANIGNGAMDIPTAWLVTIMYAFQIYFDFSGYSDIAIGLSRVVGIVVAENFNFPYVSTSISEFWRRWHISLGGWFKEYLYIPLGGNRRGEARTLLNLFAVMLVSGIWHGSGTGYLLWGCVHGMCIVLERLLNRTEIYRKIPAFIKWILTMFCVGMCWQVFRTNTLAGTLIHFKKMIGIGNGSPTFTYHYFLTGKLITLLLIALLCSTVIKWVLERAAKPEIRTASWFMLGKSAVLLALLVIVLICVTNSTYSPFIYFQY